MLLYAGESVPGASGLSQDVIYASPESGIFILLTATREDPPAEQFTPLALEILCARLERKIGSVEDRIREAITLANNEIYSLASKNGRELAFMLAVLIVEGAQASIGLVGTTRVFQVGVESIRDLAAGRSSEDGARQSEAGPATVDRPEAARTVGSREHEPEDRDFIEFFELGFEPESGLLLCSESLARSVPKADILKVISQNPGNRTRAVRALLDLASASRAEGTVSLLFIEGERLGRSLRRRATASKRNLL